jgi:hypothetical protein
MRKEQGKLRNCVVRDIIMPERDPRIDTLGNAAILTDTQIRLAFAPLDPKEKTVALKVEQTKLNLDRMQAMMRLGVIHLQIKAGFASERHIELTGPELMLIMELGDRFVTHLPAS